MRFEKAEVFGTTQKILHGPLPSSAWDMIVRNGLNVLLIGPHGTGKSVGTRKYCDEAGLTLGYYNCPHIDVSIDLLGVPSPSQDGVSFDLLKSRKLMDSDVLFFDEFLRADDRVLNALFDVIQFREISGTILPNVKSVIAATNPNDGEYHVGEIDPALLDRFDIIVYYGPAYDPEIIAAELGGSDAAKRVAEMLCEWVQADVKGYISPRRLSKIGGIFLSTRNKNLTIGALPPGVDVAVTAFWKRLCSARDNEGFVVGDSRIATDGAVKASTSGRAMSNSVATNMIRKFRDAMSLEADRQNNNVNALYARMTLDRYSPEEIAKIRENVSPALLTNTRRDMADGGVFTGSHKTVGGILSLCQTVPNSEEALRWTEFMRCIAKLTGSGEADHDWFVNNGFR